MVIGASLNRSTAAGARQILTSCQVRLHHDRRDAKAKPHLWVVYERIRKSRNETAERKRLVGCAWAGVSYLLFRRMTSKHTPHGLRKRSLVASEERGCLRRPIILVSKNAAFRGVGDALSRQMYSASTYLYADRRHLIHPIASVGVQRSEEVTVPWSVSALLTL